MQSTSPRHKRLIYGVERFRREFKPGYDSLFKQLASDQNPHTLFITCSDSRISPNLITATDPGELFIVRNVGNIIPRMSGDDTPAEGAAIEFALGKLGVQEIVVCGHSHCGAVKGVMSGEIFTSENAKKFQCMNRWLSDLRNVKDGLLSDATLEDAIEANVLQQIDNLMTYPIVRERVRAGSVRVHGWYYDIENSDLLSWNEKSGEFLPVLGHSRKNKSPVSMPSSKFNFQQNKGVTHENVIH